MLKQQLAWIWLAVLACPLRWPLVTADADFESVRVNLDKDWSGKQGDPEQKYFRMSRPSHILETG